jgi:hypothetical protein
MDKFVGYLWEHDDGSTFLGNKPDQNDVVLTKLDHMATMIDENHNFLERASKSTALTVEQNNTLLKNGNDILREILRQLKRS